MGSINYSQAIRPDKAYLKKLIENSLLADWAIRIEYQGGTSNASSWQIWDKTFFAIRSAEAVLIAILDCYAKHPKSTIRIKAEKFLPQSMMMYTVYNPEYLPAETDLAPHRATRQRPGDNEQSTLQIELRT